VLSGGDELLRNFLLLLADKGRSRALEEIARSSSASSPRRRAC
jgi:F0F1-type ATP synthase delta subunit